MISRLQNYLGVRHRLGYLVTENKLLSVKTCIKQASIHVLHAGSFDLSSRQCEFSLPKNTALISRVKTVAGIVSQLIRLKIVPLKHTLTQNELMCYVEKNASNFFHYAYQSMYLDYRIISKRLHLIPASHHYYLQIAAVKKTDLDHHLLSLKKQKIKFFSVDVECFSLTRLVQYLVKPLPDIYMLIFFSSKKFLLLVIEKGYVIYKHDYRFTSEDHQVKEEVLRHAINFTQSLYSSFNFEYFAVIGNSENVIYPDQLKHNFHYFNLQMRIKNTITHQDAAQYYPVIGLTL
jgi:hypothetical protein